MTDVDFPSLLKRMADGETLDTETSARAFGAIMSGDVSEARMAAFLTVLAFRKPTVDEIVGAARAMRSAMLTVEAGPGAIDLCGTGGDGQHTLNISTASAFVVAACGVEVAKHGNRSMSSKSGTADVLEALGVRLDLDPPSAARCLREAGLCFLFAQAYHPAMRFAAPVRRELGFRTIFNLLGPLCNPARVRRQLVGVYAREWVEPVAQALAQLGAESAWVVHGGGTDEITTTGTTAVAILDEGHIFTDHITPEDAGILRGRRADLQGGTASENACALRRLLARERGPYRDIVLLNSAAALVVGEKAGNLTDGVMLAAEAIDSGAAEAKLAQLVELTNA